MKTIPRAEQDITLPKILKVSFEKSPSGVRADAQILPGTPPVGIGENNDIALHDLYAKLFFDWDTWGKHVLFAIKENLGQMSDKALPHAPDCPIHKLVFRANPKLWPCSREACAWWSFIGKQCTICDVTELVSTLKKLVNRGKNG